MHYFVEPIDNFFFRSPVPFEAGGETTATTSEFPPLPSVYAGAFKALVPRHQEKDRHAIKVRWNGLCIRDQFHFPAPADTYPHIDDAQSPGSGNGFLRPLAFTRAPLSNYPLQYVLHRQDHQDESAQKHKVPIVPYLSQDVLHLYLHANVGAVPFVNLKKYLTIEHKLGIGVDASSGTVSDERLYQIAYARPASEMRLSVQVEGISVYEQTVIKIGGEGKRAKIYGTGSSPDVGAPSSHSKYFKLYLATPAIFKNGWLPGWVDPISKIGYFSHKKRSIKVRLLCACVGRNILCGGFNAVTNQPRELRYAVPAGSVYYFEIMSDHGFEMDIKLFHAKCVSDYRQGLGFDGPVFDRNRYCDNGFGYAFVGRLDESQEEIFNVP